MVSQTMILNAVKYVCGVVLIAGVIIFSIGVFETGSAAMTGIGIGAVMGAVFIFLMGIFFTATQEMLEKTTASNVTFTRHDNVIPFIKK